MTVISLIKIAIVIGLGVGTIWGELSEGEVAFEEEAHAGTLRKLRGRELFDRWVRRARNRRRLRMALAGLMLVLAWVLFEERRGSVNWADWTGLGVILKGYEVIQKEDGVEIRYPGGTRLILSKEAPYWDQMVDVEMVRLLLMEDADGQSILTQAEVGQLFGLSRQMTNRRKRLVEETGDLAALVKREYEKSVLREDVMRRIAEIVAEDWWKTDEEIGEQLVSEGLVAKISAGSIWKGLSRIDGRLLRHAVRERISRGESKGEMTDRYLVRRLFKLVEDLLDRLGQKDCCEEYVRLKTFAEKTEQAPKARGQYRRDVREDPACTKRNQRRKKRLLRMAIEEGLDVYKERPVCCPDCQSMAVRLKQSRPRRYKNGGCRIEETTSDQYLCQNPDCPTRTFTRLPNALEPWSRSDFFLKRKILGLVFHMRGSYRRASDFVRFETDMPGPAWTTALEWIRKAGREAVPLESLLPIRWSGVLGLDEKWVKRLSEWVYVYEAIDMKTGLPILKRVFPDRNGDNARAVLLEIKARGYIPRTIVTDLLADYDKPIRETFPKAVHQKCLFHAEKDARKLVGTYLPLECDKATREQIYVLLRDLFSTQDPVDLQAQITRFLWAKTHFPEQAAPVFNMIQRIVPHLLQPRNDPEIPTTNNATESAIKEFDAVYLTTYGYSSIPALQDFLDAYTVYQRFRRYSSGPHKGLCPLEVAGYDIGSLDWDYYLLAA